MWSHHDKAFCGWSQRYLPPNKTGVNSMKIGDLVKILSVYSREDERYIGTVGVIRINPVGMDGIWGVYVGSRTIYLSDDRLELV